MDHQVPRRRTPDISLEEVFLKAAPSEDHRSGVVAEALRYLQQGFDSHYAGQGSSDETILVGDNAYAWAVETIARLNEPAFVAVASRMIRDGAGEIAAGREVSIEVWISHLAGLLDVISGEGMERSESRIHEAILEIESARR